MGFRLLPTSWNKHLLLLLFSLHSIGLMGGGEEINFTPTEIFENSPIGSLVGSFDVNASYEYEFKLLQVTPISGENSFELKPNGTLLTKRSLDYESSSVYYMTIIAQPLTGERLVNSFDINVTNVPEIIDLVLSNNRFPENEQNASVGFLTAITDDNKEDANFTFEIIATDGNFSIEENELVVKNEFDYEQTSESKLQIRVTGTEYKDYLDQNFTLEIEDKYENQAPSDLKFFSLGIPENGEAGEDEGFVGTLLGVDSNEFDVLTYSLAGNGHNADLGISSDGKVFTKRSFDFETTQSVTLSARVTDLNGKSFDKNFTVDVLDDAFDNSWTEPTGTITGSVFGDDGKPIDLDHFEISAYDADSPEDAPRLVPTKLILEDSGDYELKIMPGRYRLYLSGAYQTHPAYQVFKPKFWDEGEIEITQDSLSLKRMYWELEPLLLSQVVTDTSLEVNGTVFDDDGNPLRGIAIEVNNADGSSKYSIASATTGSDGKFAMHLKPGLYQFQSYDYEGKWMKDSIDVEVRKAKPINDIEFKLDLRPQMTVSGHLMTKKATPANGKLTFWDWERKTHRVQPLNGSQDLDTGRYTYELPLGKYLVKASDPRGLFKDSWFGGQSRENASIVEAETNGSNLENIDLVMEEHPSFTLLITYLVGGVPVSRPPILEVTHENPSEPFGEDRFFPVGEEVSDVPGQFSYQLKSEPLGLGVLPFLSSKLISKIEREEIPENKRLNYDLVSGKWHFDEIPGKKMELVHVIKDLDLTLDLDDFSEFIKGSHFASKDNNLTTLQSMVMSTTVSGSVFSHDRSLLANSRVEARNYKTGLTHVSMTDGSGRFVFDELSAGKWSFLASPPHGATYRLIADSELYELEVEPSKDFRLDIFLKPANLTGQAVFLDANGTYHKPRLGRCWVIPSQDPKNRNISSDIYTVDLDESGRFSLHLAQGSYELTLEVFSPSGQSEQKIISFQIVNPNQVLVLGHRFSADWPKVKGASEYLLQTESYFDGYYKTLKTFPGDQSSGYFGVGTISDYHQQYRIYAKAKKQFMSKSDVDSYLFENEIQPIGSLSEQADANESVLVYPLSSYILEQLTGDSNLTDGNYSIFELPDGNSSLEPVDLMEDLFTMLGAETSREQKYIRTPGDDSLRLDQSYYVDKIIKEPELSIGFPLIEFDISDVEIGGVIYDQNGTLLSGVEVLAFDLRNNTLLRALSNDTGRYSLSVSPGSWEVETGSIVDFERLAEDESGLSSGFEMPVVPRTGKVTVEVSSKESAKNTDFMVKLDGGLIRVKGQLTDMNSSSEVNLGVYEAEVRLVSYQGEYVANLDDNGTFSLDVPEGFYEVYPWIDPRSGLFPEYPRPEFQGVNIFESYSMGSAYEALAISPDNNNSIDILVARGDSLIQGFVRDQDGIPIPGIVVSARSDLGDLLLTETNLTGFFRFSVRSQAQWTVQCDFIRSNLLGSTQYQNPEFKRFWLYGGEGEKNLEFTVQELSSQIKGSLMNPSEYLGQEAYLMKTDILGNELIVSKTLINAMGDFTFQVPRQEQLVGMYDASFTVGVIADWSGDLPAIETQSILPADLYNDFYTLEKKTPWQVTGQFKRNGNYQKGWVGEVFAISMNGRNEKKSTPDMRVEKITDDGNFTLHLSEGMWSIDYSLSAVPAPEPGFEPTPVSPLIIPVYDDIDLAVDLPEEDSNFTEIKYLNDSDSTPFGFEIELIDPSNEKVFGLCYLDMVPHYKEERSQSLASQRWSLVSTDGFFEGEVFAEGMYEIWAFPGPQLREQGFYMPRPKIVWIDENSQNHSMTIPRRLTASSMITNNFSFRVTNQPSNGEVVIDPNEGNWTYYPNPNYDGSDSFRVSVPDDFNESFATTIYLDNSTVDENQSGSVFDTTTLSGTVLGIDGNAIFLGGNSELELSANNAQSQSPIVWITSSTGLFSWWYAEWDGSFVFRDVPPNLEWYVGGFYFDPVLGKDLATFRDIGPFRSGAKDIDLKLMDFRGASPMPDQKAEFFDPWLDYQLLLEDGMEILIPKGAIPVQPDQRVIRIVVSPSLERLHRDLYCFPVGYAYEILLYDERGEVIEEPFRKKAKLKIPLNSFFMEGMSLKPSEVEIAYFDHSYNSWRPQPNQVLDQEENIQLFVDHFSTWVPIAYAETEAPLPIPMGESTEAMGGNFYDHAWFGNFFALPDSDWIFHSIHGWLYIKEINDSSIWIYDDKLEDWLWTNSENYSDGSKHFFFSNKWEGFIWHSPKSKNPRWFFDYDANAWFNDEMRFSVNVEVVDSSYGTVVGEGVYARGESPKVIANPKYGYSFDGWSGGVSSMENTIELAPLSRSVTLLARFSKIPPLNVNVVNIGEGKGTVDGTRTYEFGDIASIKAQNGDRSVFMGWWENGKKITWDKEIKFLIEENRILNAQFEPATVENILRVRYSQ